MLLIMQSPMQLRAVLNCLCLRGDSIMMLTSDLLLDVRDVTDSCLARYRISGGTVERIQAPTA